MTKTTEEAKPKRRLVEMDDELDAMHACRGALATLSPEAQSRVMAWLISRYSPDIARKLYEAQNGEG